METNNTIVNDSFNGDLTVTDGIFIQPNLVKAEQCFQGSNFEI